MGAQFVLAFVVSCVSMSMASQLYDLPASQNVTNVLQCARSASEIIRRVAPGADRGMENIAPDPLIDPNARRIYIAPFPRNATRRPPPPPPPNTSRAPTRGTRGT